MHPRFQDWPTRLAEFIETRRFTPFKWGKNDCCLFAAGWVMMVTGRDAAARLRGYTTALGAAKKISKFGDTVEDIPAKLGFIPVAPAFAQRGDLVSSEVLGRVFLCICTGAEMAGAGKDGIIFNPMSIARKAWRV